MHATEGNPDIAEKLHGILREDGAIKVLVKMARHGNIDVIAQVARGMANFAKCESRGILQGLKIDFDMNMVTHI